MIRRSSSAVVVALLGVVGVVLSGAPAIAQSESTGAVSQPTGRLAVIVQDPSGALLQQAVVELRRAAPAGEWRPLPRRVGEWLSDSLPAGLYDLRVSAPGFVSRTFDTIHLDTGSTRRLVQLALDRIETRVVVERDRQSAALDPRGFSTFLSRAQIDALPDDPAEMGRLLREMAPPGAVLHIDGFTGGVMPSKAQILSIRIPRIDALAAEDHGGLNAFSTIDIVTRPGGGEWHGIAGISGRGKPLDARNPLTSTQPPDWLAVGDIAFDGPIRRDRVSLAIQFRGSREFETATIRAALPDNASYVHGVPRPTIDVIEDGRLIAMLKGDQTLRANVFSVQHAVRNAGVGEYNLDDRRYDTQAVERTVRLAVGGPWGPQRQIGSRLELKWAGTRSRSAIEAPTIQVLDAFTSGGAQATNGERSMQLTAASDLDYARGGHAVRTGVLLSADGRAANRRANYEGTYIFASLEAFADERPAFFTRRIGDARVKYTDQHLGVYAQDDYRASSSLLISYGIRSEWQNLLSTAPSLLPRAGLTWSPHRNGSPTLRVSGGLVREWLPAPVYEQARLVDGLQQYDLRIAAPAFPDPGYAGVVLPRERFLLADDLELPRGRVVSFGLEQQVTRALRLYLSSSVRHGSGLLRGENINAGIDGRRPDESSGSIIEARGDAALRARTLTAQAIYSPRGRAVDAAATYMLNRSLTNTAGAFWLSATRDLTQEWGPLTSTHAAVGSITGRWRHFVATLSPRWRSGTPYTVTLPDASADGLFNVRPPGVARNASRTAAQGDLGARLVYSFGLGTERAALETAAADGAPARDPAGIAPARRPYQLELQAAVQNLTNRPNYLAVGSVIGSPLFGRPISAAPARTIVVGMRLRF